MIKGSQEVNTTGRCNDQKVRVRKAVHKELENLEAVYKQYSNPATVEYMSQQNTHTLDHFTI